MTMRYLSVLTVLATMLSGPTAARSQSTLGAPVPRRPPVDTLELRGPGSQIGASFRNLATTAAEPNRGAIVIEVQPKSPAALAGLRAGDQVTGFDGIRVSSARALNRLVAETPPGRTVDVTVLRDGRARTLKVTPMLGRLLG